MPRAFLLAAAIICIIAFALTLLIASFDDAATFYLYKEDRWLLLAGAASLALAGWRGRPSVQSFTLSPRLLAFAGGAMVLLLYLGHYWILCGYDLSRDEQMAVFDSRIFATGHLVQPLPALWQAHPDALNRLYMLAILHPTAWSSAYLPMNAALRALVDLFGDAALTGPLLTILGGVALWKCARLLWPQDREPALLALLLYAVSGQVVLAGMSAFAMPSHLCFNLIWLWLYLLDRRGADLAALLIGFVTTGLHQPLFHPLFAAPFLMLLVTRRAWGRLALFGLGYAAICAFWGSWPGWMVALSGGAQSPPPDTDYWSRLKLVLMTNNSPRLLYMTANLLRFVAWQHVLLLPLAAIGCVRARSNGLVAALAASVLLPVGVMAIILPAQGNGFGYRYLHGEIGCLILLAAFGWQSLGLAQSWVRPILLRATGAMIVLVLPLQMAMSHALYAAYARSDAAIASSGMDYVLLDQEDAPFAVNLILNRADLSNRPVRLDARAMDGALRRQLCATHPRVALPHASLFAPIGFYLGWPLDHSVAEPDIAALAPRLRAEGCRLSLLG